MELEVTPPVEEPVVEALATALQAEREGTRPAPSAWKQAALTEQVERDETYALSPRSTRGATRA